MYEYKTCEIFLLSWQNYQIWAETKAMHYLPPTSLGKIKLESTESVSKVLKCSPDLASAFILTMAGQAVSASLGSKGSTAWNKPLKREIKGIV